MKRRKAARPGTRRPPLAAGDGELLRTARSYLAEGRADFAAMILERAVQAQPEAPELRLALAEAARRLGRWQQCETLCAGVLAEAPLQPEAWLALAEALLAQGRDAVAQRHLAELPRVKASAAALARLGTLCLEHGYLEPARAALERAFDRDPQLPGLALSLARVVRFDAGQRPLIARIQALLEPFAREPLLLADVHFALGKAHEDLGDDARAAAHYHKANACVAGTVHFDAGAHARAVEAIVEVFDAAQIRRLAPSGDRSECPILIVGMPRSGTTLVEQVLAAHPQVAAAGECGALDDTARGLKRHMSARESYPRCVARMGPADVAWVAQSYLERLRSLHPGAARITDKMPTNFLHLGLVAACLPGARIVHCTRDPQDTAVSVYFQQFASGNDWAYRPRDIAAFYAGYERLMAHWRSLSAGGAGPVMFELAYEDLVREGESRVRALLGFLGLEWDDACLAHTRGKGAVRTASNWQVRQPMHTASVGRGERFAPYLPELHQAVARRNAPG